MENLNQVQKRETNPQQQVERTHNQPTYIPDTDIYEKEQTIVVVADMPGVDESSVNIHLEKGILTLTGHMVAGDVEGHHLLHREFDGGVYERSFSLSDDIDTDKIEAQMKNGVLTLTMAKSEQAKPKHITVKVEK